MNFNHGPCYPCFPAQPAGQPEISRRSLEGCSVAGGESLFVIGKNFVKGFKVKFQEIEKGTDVILWEQEAEVEQEYVHNVSYHCVACIGAGRVSDGLHGNTILFTKYCAVVPELLAQACSSMIHTESAGKLFRMENSSAMENGGCLIMLVLCDIRNKVSI